MDSPPIEEYTIKADNQIYTVQKSHYLGCPTYEYLKIADGRRCIQYSYKKDNSVEIELDWLHLACAYGGCITTHMEKLEKLFHVSVQILKLNTQSTYIDFFDSPNFYCLLPNGTIGTIYISRYYFVFYGTNWCHEKMGAYPTDTYSQTYYKSAMKMYDDPKYKKKDFYFRNEDLCRMFYPIWYDTKTWKEFMGRIEKFPNICQKAYPWYYDASLFGGTMPERWRIDLTKMNYPEVTYERIENPSDGFPSYILDSHVCLDYPSPAECKSLKYLL